MDTIGEKCFFTLHSQMSLFSIYQKNLKQFHSLAICILELIYRHLFLADSRKHLSYSIKLNIQVNNYRLIEPIPFNYEKNINNLQDRVY